MGQQFGSSILFLQLTEGVDAFVLWCYTSTAWRDVSSFWGQGVWSVGKKDEDYLRAKGRCYWNDNLDDTEILLGQFLASVLLGHHGDAVSHNMACDLTVWENRKLASAKLTQVVGYYMISLVGTNMTEHLTERLRHLEQENAHLRATQAHPTTTRWSSRISTRWRSTCRRSTTGWTRHLDTQPLSQQSSQSPLSIAIQPTSQTSTSDQSSHIHSHSTCQTSPTSPTPTSIWHQFHTPEPDQTSGEHASWIILQGVGRRRTQQSSDSSNQCVDEDHETWCCYSQQIGWPCQEAWWTDCSTTTWPNTQHQQVPRRMGNGTHQSFQVQTSRSHQTLGHFARNSPMTMWPLQPCSAAARSRRTLDICSIISAAGCPWAGCRFSNKLMLSSSKGLSTSSIS